VWDNKRLIHKCKSGLRVRRVFDGGFAAVADRRLAGIEVCSAADSRTSDWRLSRSREGPIAPARECQEIVGRAGRACWRLRARRRLCWRELMRRAPSRRARSPIKLPLGPCQT